MAEPHIGKWPVKKLLNLTGHNTTASRIGALFLLGVAIAGIRQSYSFALSMPGHHGLELMTALIFARLVTRQPWAAVIVVTGTVSGNFVFGNELLHAAKHAPLFLMVGFLVDIFYRYLGDRCRALPVAAMVGALAHVAKPLVLMLLATMVDIKFGFFRHGPVYPLVTYASFGAVGAVCGALLARAWRENPEAK